MEEKNPRPSHRWIGSCGHSVCHQQSTLGGGLAGQWGKDRAPSTALDGSLCMRKNGPAISMDLSVDWTEQDWKLLEKRHKLYSWERAESLGAFGPHWCREDLEQPGRGCLLWWAPACSVLGYPRACATGPCTECHGCRVAAMHGPTALAPSRQGWPGCCGWGPKLPVTKPDAWGLTGTVLEGDQPLHGRVVLVLTGTDTDSCNGFAFLASPTITSLENVCFTSMGVHTTSDQQAHFTAKEAWQSAHSHGIHRFY